MMVGSSGKRRLAKLLMSHAAGRLRIQHPDWADAMVSESAEILGEEEHLRWSAGCLVASYRAPGVLDRIVYPAALSAGVVLMTTFQWNADESLRTIALLCMICMTLGVLQPRRSLLSGIVIGLVVAAVNGFETVTGLRPTYEPTTHSLLHDALWSVLIAPAMIASLIGRFVGRMCQLTTNTAP